jgi:hypothetical protein
MAQVEPLRECQDIMGPASACLVLIWSAIRRKLPFACVSGMHCEMPSQWWPASVPVGRGLYPDSMEGTYLYW